MQEESRGPKLKSLKEEQRGEDGRRGRRGNHEEAMGLTTACKLLHIFLGGYLLLCNF